MKKNSKLIQPIQFYFALFLSVGIAILAGMVWSFYTESKHIQQTVEQQTKQEALHELVNAIAQTIKNTETQLQAIAEWDEVHQQYHNPSYYFFWHDERLKESSYYQPYYDALELYHKNGKLLMPASPDQNAIQHANMPIKLKEPETVVHLSPNKEAHLETYYPVYERGSDSVMGYVGVSLDLKAAMLLQNQFFYLDKSSLYMTGNKTVPIKELVSYIQFSPISNPVNNYLWELIQKFIVDLIIILAVVSLLLIFIFNNAIRSPLEVLSNYLLKLKEAPQEKHTPPKKHFLIKEYEELKNTIHQYHSQLQQAHLELDQQNLVVWEQARRDALTNVYNRRAFDEAWSDVIRSFKETSIPTAFVLFDCDFFKALNDTYGHEVGDEVIRLSAKSIQQALPMECPPYRIGGDEFAVIIQHRSLQEITMITQFCLDALRNTSFTSLGIKEKLTFSVGISSIANQENDCITHLPRQADIAMYKAKQSHQTKIQVYNQALEDQSSSLVSKQMINTIVNSIHTGENIQMHFQPIVSIETGNWYYESLLRIKGTDGLIYPGEIFSLIERRRLEVEMDHQVILATLSALESGRIPENSGLSINISGKTLLQPDLVSLFEPFNELLTKYKIVIEITENILIDHIDYAQNVLNELRDKGFLIALDDFGSGYSSIRYLAHMPVDIIKFDMTMTQALNSDSKTKQIIISTADMVRRSGFDLVMEGIETEEMYEQAKAAGATHLQGYLLGKPMAEIQPPKRPN